MRIASLVAGAIVVVAFGCSDATIPTAPHTDITLATAPGASGPAFAFSASGDPVPDPVDRILLDTRTSLQQATSLGTAVAAFGTGVSKAGPWAFTSNADGAGTNALRIDWPRRLTTTCTYATANLGVPLPTPRATRMYVQWKQRLGRTETGGGVGRIGEFIIGDRCSGLARAEWTALRDVVPASDASRLEYQWRSPSPFAARITAFMNPSVIVGALPGSTFRPAEHVAQTITQTMYLQAESAQGARDGVVRLWVNGTLVVDQSGLAIGPEGFRRLRFPGRMAQAGRPQSEYLWDVVAWEPAATPEDPPTNPAPVAAVHVDPATATVSIGSSQSLVATVRDADGNTLPDRSVTWASSAPEIVSVDGAGLATGVAAGSATITATSEGKSGSATVTVQQVPVASISIAPTTPRIIVGRTVQMTATVRDANGNVLTGRTISWATSSPGTATVSDGGLVTGAAVGTSTITASSEGKSAGTDVTVEAPPPAPAASVTVTPETATIAPAGTVQLSATVRDAGGNVLTGRTIGWRSVNTAVATVSTSGLVTGVSGGAAMVIATTESVADTASITVTSPPPPPPSAGDFVVFPTAAHAAIMGPQLKSGSARNPYPWFDSHAISMGKRVGQEFMSSPTFPSSEVEGRNYYDQALVQYINYYRTGDVAFLNYARAIADAWWKMPHINEGRAPTNDNNVVGRQISLGGLMVRALDGRPEMWPYIVSWGRNFYDVWLGTRINGNELHYGVRDGGYTLLYVAWIAQAHPDAAIRAEFKQKALVAARDYYARLQYPDGSWRWRSTPGDGSVPHTQPFMVGLLLEGMIATHQLTGDETVKQAILKGVTNLYTGLSYRKGTYRHFWYTVYGSQCNTPTAPACGGTLEYGLASERQLNTLAAHSFGYAYKISGDPQYLTWGDEFFDATYGGSDGTRASLGWVKEYNQGFRSSGRYLAWRIGG